MNLLTRRLIIAATASLAFAGHAAAQDKSIVVASTTSTQDSGLFSHILPMFKAKTGIDVKVVAQGTGQALDTARRGDADVVFVHAKAAEEAFLKEGFGVKGHRGGTKDAERQADHLRLAWRPLGHARGRAGAVESGGGRRRAQRRYLVQ